MGTSQESVNMSSLYRTNDPTELGVTNLRRCKLPRKLTRPVVQLSRAVRRLNCGGWLTAVHAVALRPVHIRHLCALSWRKRLFAFPGRRTRDVRAYALPVSPLQASLTAGRPEWAVVLGDLFDQCSEFEAVASGHPNSLLFRSDKTIPIVWAFHWWFQNVIDF